MFYVRYPLSHRQVEDILHERGIDICHETVRFWVGRFGSLFADHNYSKSEMTNDSAHYGADHLMVQDVVAFLRQECDRLPVSIVDALEAGVAALGIDQARASGQVIDLSPIWSEFDSYNLRQRKN